MELFWNGLKRKNIFQEKLLESAVMVLERLTLDAMSKRRDLILDRTNIKEHEAIFQSGMVQFKKAAGANAGEGTECRFVHNTFFEYFCASSLKNLKKTSVLTERLKEVIHLAPTERKMLVFLSAMMTEEQSKVLVAVIAERFLALVELHNLVFETEMDRTGDHLSTRERFRKLFGVDLCIECITLIDEKLGQPTATDAFMNAIRPFLGRFAALVPKRVREVTAPTHYRLMFECAARYGNMLMLERLYRNTPVKPMELNAAHVFAFCSKRGKTVIDFLVEKGAIPISLPLVCSVGDVDSVKRVLARDFELDNAQFEET